MLLAVEGGGFFSSSALGYSKGLALLLLGRRNEERPMRVSPWNQYQLVEQEVATEFQLASRKNQSSCGCASFLCFGCVPAGIDGPSPPKVGPAHQPEVLSDSSSSSSSSDNGKLAINDGINGNGRNAYLKSNLKRPSADHSAVVSEVDGARESVEEMPKNTSCCVERRKVQWTDACGKELAEIREFEVSDDGLSDEECERDGIRRCECVIQ
ncbi:uncharacterized protein LOC103697637 [Phoenix dactylifera]|uniref:Uncharacterized protein LOC103697637 n=1 Tax=Phoenix dactylifera TaxID=42345 RepID=A0A8B7BIK6_PHODC|nr:uncharacterized protein LOC103697637 [Phoenix dactylifera]XP_038976193.1 uncharacterized protein LOC103697637 [Phoenix dactylifera]